jgi:hypothetical protein
LVATTFAFHASCPCLLSAALDITTTYYDCSGDIRRNFFLIARDCGSWVNDAAETIGRATAAETGDVVEDIYGAHAE